MWWRIFTKEQTEQYFKYMKKLTHKHEWVLEKEVSQFMTNLRTYKCKCGEEKETYQIWGLQEVDM